MAKLSPESEVCVHVRTCVCPPCVGGELYLGIITVSSSTRAQVPLLIFLDLDHTVPWLLCALPYNA